jgi:hypothetical protein
LFAFLPQNAGGQAGLNANLRFREQQYVTKLNSTGHLVAPFKHTPVAGNITLDLGLINRSPWALPCPTPECPHMLWTGPSQGGAAPWLLASAPSFPNDPPFDLVVNFGDIFCTGNSACNPASGACVCNPGWLVRSNSLETVL